MSSRIPSCRSTIAALLLGIGCHACMEPPPKIPAVPATGFALRLYVFGASAEDAHRTFATVKENNPSFQLVNAGGNGEVLVGLENDSPHCVAPTAMCSYRVSYRIRDNAGAVVSASTTTIEATSDRCSDLCDQALNHVAVKVVETAATLLLGGGNAKDESEDAGSPGALADSGTVAPARPQKRAAKVEPPKPEPTICNAGHGPRLPAQEAERRAAQVEVLKRMSLLDQDEYDCLRRAYLERL
jgi:hypothetical protein